MSIGPIVPTMGMFPSTGARVPPTTGTWPITKGVWEVSDMKPGWPLVSVITGVWLTRLLREPWPMVMPKLALKLPLAMPKLVLRPAPGTKPPAVGLPKPGSPNWKWTPPQLPDQLKLVCSKKLLLRLV